MLDGWYYADAEGSVGPMSIEELKETLATFTDAKDMLVWREGFPDWKRARDIPQLRTKPRVPPPLLSREGLAGLSAERQRGIEFNSRSRMTTVRPAHLRTWAAYGFVFGLVMGALDLQPWEGDAIRINLITLLSMGIGNTMLAIFLAGLWNWAGRTKST
jgi:hypothetical protein